MPAGGFSKTAALLNGPDFVTERSGSQVYVSRYGEQILDIAAGMRDAENAMSTVGRMVWLCCSKPVLLIALSRVFADSGLSEYTPVADIIPEFAHAGKADVTFSHLLTHTVSYRSLGVTWTGERVSAGDETPVMTAEWDTAVKIVCETPISARPGELVTYTPVTNWLILAEALERLTGRCHEESVRDLVLQPLGMDHTSVYLTPAARAELDSAPLWDLDTGAEPCVDSMDLEPWVYSRWPGLACRGPARDMARPVECAAGWLRPDVLDDAWRAKLTQPRRLDLGDPVFQGAEIMWSLGLCADPVPYGLPMSARVAGHTGVRSSFVFADLDTGITVSFLSSGLVPKARDWSRKRALVRVIYDELGVPLAAR